MYDLSVAYRIYPGIGKPVAIFNNDKLKLTEFAFKSFLHSLGNLKVELFVLLDSCPPKYKEIILSNFSKSNFIELHKAGNCKTFELQLELLLHKSRANLVYFAEDDYFYLPNALQLAVDFFQSYNPDFLTLYFHPDYQNWEFHRIEKPAQTEFGNRIWQTVATTTLTFLTTKKTLFETKKVFLSFVKKNYDSSLWLSLTKKGIFKPKFYSLPFTSQRKKFYFKMITKMWLYNWRQILLGKKFSLYSPNPSLATHLEKDSLSPNVDWPPLFETFCEQWQFL